MKKIKYIIITIIFTFMLVPNVLAVYGTQAEGRDFCYETVFHGYFPKDAEIIQSCGAEYYLMNEYNGQYCNSQNLECWPSISAYLYHKLNVGYDFDTGITEKISSGTELCNHQYGVTRSGQQTMDYIDEEVSKINKDFDSCITSSKNDADAMIKCGETRLKDYKSLAGVCPSDSSGDGSGSNTNSHTSDNSNVNKGNLKINETLSLCDASSSSNGLKAFQVIGYILLIMKVVVPLILVVMGSIDFAKAVISTNDKPNKEVISAFVMRIVAGIIIFFIPTILNLVTGLIDDMNTTISENNESFGACTRCLFDPLGDCEAKNLGE